MSEFVCPRCQVAVIASGGEDPRCGVCDYPGLDIRPEDERHPVAPGDDRVLSGKAVASMVLGITGVAVPVAGLATSITAIPLAISARREIEASDGLMKGKGQANAGLAMGIVGIAVQAALLSGSAAAWWHRLRR